VDEIRSQAVAEHESGVIVGAGQPGFAGERFGTGGEPHGVHATAFNLQVHNVTGHSGRIADDGDSRLEIDLHRVHCQRRGLFAVENLQVDMLVHVVAVSRLVELVQRHGQFPVQGDESVARRGRHFREVGEVGVVREPDGVAHPGADAERDESRGGCGQALVDLEVGRRPHGVGGDPGDVGGRAGAVDGLYLVIIGLVGGGIAMNVRADIAGRRVDG